MAEQLTRNEQVWGSIPHAGLVGKPLYRHFLDSLALLILEQIFPGSSVFVGSVNGREVIDYWKS